MPCVRDHDYEGVGCIMAVEAARVAVSTTAAKLTTSTLVYSGVKQAVLVQAPAAATLFVGGPAVTAAAGFPINAGTSVSIDLTYGEELFGILASGTGSAAVLRAGV